jgi:hypothetical protein
VSAPTLYAIVRETDARGRVPFAAVVGDALADAWDACDAPVAMLRLLALAGHPDGGAAAGAAIDACGLSRTAAAAAHRAVRTDWPAWARDGQLAPYLSHALYQALNVQHTPAWPVCAAIRRTAVCPTVDALVAAVEARSDAARSAGGAA